MRIIVDPGELADLRNKMKNASQDIERLGRALESTWRSVDYEGSQRGSLDAAWAEMAGLFGKLAQQYEEMAAFLNKKSEGFAEADGQETGFSAGKLLKWAAVVLGTTLDFVPVVGNVKGIVDAAVGYDVFTKEKLTNVERVLSMLGPAGKTVKKGSQLIGMIDDAASVSKQGERASDAARAVDRAGDSAKAADNAGNAAKTADQAGDAAKAADQAGDGGTAVDRAGDAANSGKDAAASGPTVNAAPGAARHGDEAAAAAENTARQVDEAATGTAGLAAAGGAGAAAGIGMARTPYSGVSAGSRIQKKDGVNPRSTAGDPVDTSTGAQIIEHPLLHLKGAEDLTFSISYHSLLNGSGALGLDWSHNYEIRLEQPAEGTLEVWWSSFRSNTYQRGEDGIFRSRDVDVLHDRIIRADGGYRLVRKDQKVLLFSAEGQLKEIRNPAGQTQRLSFDTQGRLLEIKDALSGRSFQLSYSETGLLQSVVDPLGYTASFLYTAGRLTDITPPDHSLISCAYTPEGRLSSMRSGEGIVYFVNEYDNEGRVARQKDALGQWCSFDYDEERHPGWIITTFTNREGATRVFTHDDRYRLIALQDELGHVTRYEYNEQGLCTLEVEPDGKESIYVYDEKGQLTERRMNGQLRDLYRYNEFGSLISYIDGEGNAIDFEYDEHHRPVLRKDSEDGLIRISYNEQGLMQTMEDQSGAVTRYSYDAFGNLVTVTDPLGCMTRYEYDAGGRITQVTDPAGGVIRQAYNVSHQVVSVTDPLGAVTTYDYDKEGALRRQIDPLGHARLYKYNAAGNLIEEQDELGRTVRYRYDNEERVIQVVHTNGASTCYAYDGAGRLLQSTDPSGVVTRYQYDAAGRVTKVTDGEGYALRSVRYDKDGNPAAVVNALGHAVNYRFNRLGQILEKENAKGDITAYAYDGLSRLVRVNQCGQESSRAFTAAGQLAGYRDAAGNETKFRYDMAGRPAEEITPAGTQLTYDYDPRGFLIRRRSARGIVITYTPDAAGRLHKQEDGAGTLEHQYDAAGRLITISESTGDGTAATIEKRTYDSLGRVTSYTNERGQTIRYEYDGLGNVSVLHYPDGKKVTYRYDAAGRMTEVRDWKKRVTAYSYDERGQLVRTDRPNGTAELRAYDKEGQLISLLDTGVKGRLLQQYRYCYDAAGLLIKENETRYEYNSWGALTAANASRYTYDASGNMTCMEEGDSQIRMSYAADNRLRSVNGEDVAMDEDGNLLRGRLRGRSQDFVYDARDRLVQAGSITYGYNAENERTWMNVKGQTTLYVVNPHAEYSELLLETDEAGRVSAAYVYGLGLIGRESADGRYQSYHYDLRGSTTRLTDEEGDVTDRYTYGAFGELVKHEGTTRQPFAYNGRDGVQTDINGLYYMRARYYNPDIKRFMNRDVLRGEVSLGLSMNRFAYVNGNPVTFVDPLGLDAIQAGKSKGIGNGYQYWNKTTQFKNVKVYQRDDIINQNMKDARGRTNLERMQKGLAPLGPDGKSINLHHMTQRNESSIAEVTQTFHKDNSSVIHINPNTIPSGINRSEFNKWRTDYWKNRANDF
ncbi:HNH/ENDO VII family nuclease [Paenibacillus sp. JSM ZJ436]